MVPHHFACRTGLVIPNDTRLAAGQIILWRGRGHHVPASIALVEDGLEPEA
jgi:hypothetical protein